MHFRDLPVSRHFSLNMAICLTVRDFIAGIVDDQEVKAKWPNDIYIKNRKIAGLLIQNQLRNKSIARSIIGIGLNVNEKKFPDNLPHATSLFQQTDTNYKLITLVRDMSVFFPVRLEYYLSDSLDLEEHYKKALWGIHEEHHFKDSQSKRFKGIIRGVNTEGKLLVESVHGLRSYNNHEIELILE